MGFGRGRWKRTGTKPLLEAFPALDVLHLHRKANLRQWSVFTLNLPKLTIQGEANPERIRLTYPDRTVETLPLSWPRCGLGGQRPLAGCPGCGRGAIKFYFDGGRFRCRKCHGLQYLSTRINDVDAAKARLARVRQRLGDEPCAPLEPAPWKPRGMWTRTYLTLLDQFNDAQGQALEALGKRLGRIAERMA